MRGYRPTIRLALTYECIIVVLSLGFSIIFFFTSLGSLHVDVQHARMPEAGPRISNVSTADGERSPTTPNIDPNKELTTRLSAVRKDLARQLVWLNVGVVLGGGLLSYYLARRTLRPIEAAMERQARFSADASHELRTPVTALRTRAEVALRNPSLTVAAAKAALENSIEQAVRLEHITEGLLKLSQGGQPLPSPVRLHDVANKAIEQLEKKSQAKRIKLDQAVPRDLVALADSDSLVQVLAILLDNAVKYSPKASTVTIKARKDGSRLILSVSDQGIGIDPADVAHIFERFYRADQARRQRDSHSFGLGLAIAKQLVTLNKGTITASSEPGKGSHFTVTLPAA